MTPETQPSTGVFVRLPLSAEQEETCFEISERDCLNSAIAAIGTPVAGGEFYPVGYIAEEAIGGLAAGIYQSASIFRDEDKEHHDIVALVRLEYAQSALAAAQAESVRLRRALQEIHDTGHDLPEFMRIEMMVAEAAKALKGPEA